ncbi:sensor histidine kinase [Streptomyces sp. NPDC058613]|uniref:sensor histidine kinase n=1 Tax=Streptomyces sp. NPDC058613 TaxID=3346556 RepID=UPI0036569C0C
MTTGPARPLPWLPPVVHTAVLFGGLYGVAVAGGPPDLPRAAAFSLTLLLLAVLDHAERRRFPGRTPPRPAVALLLARLTLYVAANVADTSGVARALLVLVPIAAFFAFGRRASIVLSVTCTGLLLAKNTLRVPQWFLRTDLVTDLLMSGLALVLAITMAGVALREQEARVRLGRALAELGDSHDRLSAYAARVAELSATQERNRLAREFHDGLGHHLTAIAIQLEKAAAFQDLDADAVRHAINAARGSADRALDEVRQSVRTLRDESEPFSLSVALADLVGHSDGGAQRVTLGLSGEERGHPVTLLTALYRAAQEGLTNAHRHSGAAHIALSAEYGEHETRLVISDDGLGFPSDGPRDGFGLRAMRERLGPLGGEVMIDTAPGRGTVVTVTVPREPVPEAAR